MATGAAQGELIRSKHMATRRHHSPANVRQEEARRCRQNMQRLLNDLAAHLPAQQPALQSAFLLQFHHAAQANASKQHKGAH
jgi:hypothetical protein